MENTVTTTYAGIEITYQESKDNWTFELDGKEKFAKSLANAKAAIDAPERKAKKAPFVAFSALMVDRWSHKPERVTVTSFTEDHRPEAWVTKKDGRRKVSIGDLYVDSPQTLSILAQVQELDKEMDTLRKKSEHKLKEMKNIEAPPKGE